VGAIQGGFLAVLQVKTGSRHADEASCAGGQAQEAMILCNDGEGGS
jgi:hypothetical protein